MYATFRTSFQSTGYTITETRNKEKKTLFLFYHLFILSNNFERENDKSFEMDLLSTDSKVRSKKIAGCQCFNW